ncbi:MAG: hypothetical protein WBA35_05890, partial [Litorimonas sp.]
MRLPPRYRTRRNFALAALIAASVPTLYISSFFSWESYWLQGVLAIVCGLVVAPLLAWRFWPSGTRSGLAMTKAGLFVVVGTFVLSGFLFGLIQMPFEYNRWSSGDFEYWIGPLKMALF